MRDGTLHEILAAAGYGNRATARTPATQKREVFRLSDGEPVAHLRADEVLPWLREGGQIRDARQKEMAL